MKAGQAVWRALIAWAIVAAPAPAVADTGPPGGGLVLWLDAEEPGDAISGTGELRVWKNRAAPESRSAGQPRQESQPRLLDAGGRKVVRFDGDDDFLHLPWLLLDRDFSLFVVVAPEKQTEGRSAWRGIFCGDADAFRKEGGSQYALFVPAGGNPFRYLGESPRGDLKAAPFRLGQTPMLPSRAIFDLVQMEVCARGRVDSFSLRRQGRLVDRRGLPDVARSAIRYEAGYVIGQGGDARAGAGSRHFRGGIAELLVYDRGLTARERVLAERYLAGKHGLPQEPAPPVDGLQVWLDAASHGTAEAEFEVTEQDLALAAAVRNEGAFSSRELSIANPDVTTQPRHKPRRFDGSAAFRFAVGEGWAFSQPLPFPHGTTLAAVTRLGGRFEIVDEWLPLALPSPAFAGDLHELLHYDRELEPEERSLVCQYLSARHAPPADPRRFENGEFLFTNGYIDQPYTVVCEDGSWLTVVTTSNFSEASGDFFLLTTRSRDEGRTWSRPVAVIEPPTFYRPAWATLMRGPGKRVFCFYNVKESRGDTRGRLRFCYRWSDDHGATWSDARGEIPLERLDHEAPEVSPNGWSVCPPFHRDGKVYLTFTRFVPPGRSEGRGFLFRSPDLLTAAHPAAATWERLPQDHRGLRNDEVESSCQEEHIVVPLAAPGHLYAVWRTGSGVALEACSRDDGATWTPGTPVRFAGGDGDLLRQPLACMLPARLRDGRFVLWFHNASGPERGKPSLPRDVAWASLGEERDGRLYWSQPEVISYGYDLPANHLGLSYPGVIEHEAGVSFLCTDKMTARRLLFPRDTIDAMRRQLAAGACAPLEGCIEVEPGSGPVARSRSGFTLELSFTHRPSRAGRDLVTLRDEGGARVGGIAIPAGSDHLECELVDRSGRVATLPIGAGSLAGGAAHRFTWIVDLEAGLSVPLLDEAQAPVAEGRDRAWMRLPEDFSIPETLVLTRGAEQGRVAWVDRAVLLSQAILSQRK